MRLIAITLTFLAAAALAAVVQADDTRKRSPELQVLDRFVGTWDVEVSVKPAGEAEINYNAISTRSWSQRGTFIHFDDPNLERPEEPEFQMLLTYDPEARNYPGVMMMGPSRCQITGTWDEQTKAMSFEATLPDGNKLTSTHRFIDEDHADPSGVIKNPEGKVVLDLSWKQTRRKETAVATDAKAEAIIANHLKAIGGDTALQKLTTRQLTGTLSYPGFGAPWKMTGTQKAPNLRHFTVDVPGFGVVTEGFDGKVAWKSEPGKETRQLAGEEFTMSRREGFFYKYIDLKSQYKTLTYEGREKVKGKEYQILGGIYEDGHKESLYLDVKSHLIRLVKHETETGAVTVELSDYREVDGVQMPFSAVVFLGTGKATLSIKLDEIAHGVKVDDAIFAMPTD